jgi:putative transposase
LTAGQAGDNPQLAPWLNDYAGACMDRGVPGRDFRLLGDKAYSHPSTRTELRSRRIKHTIPERQDQLARRKAKGSAGGRPPAFDAAVYGLPNTVERGFNRLKQWRGIATRYDKYALTAASYWPAPSFTRAWAPLNWETRPSRPGNMTVGWYG